MTTKSPGPDGDGVAQDGGANPALARVSEPDWGPTKRERIQMVAAASAALEAARELLDESVRWPASMAPAGVTSGRCWGSAARPPSNASAARLPNQIDGVKLHAHLREQNLGSIDPDAEFHADGDHDVVYVARLDEVPDAAVEVDEAALPTWLRRKQAQSRCADSGMVDFELRSWLGIDR